jgi:hypothetical protein
VAWHVSTAKAHESGFVAPLIDGAQERGFPIETVAADKGYDFKWVYDDCSPKVR